MLVLEVRIKALVGLLKMSPAGTTKCVPDIDGGLPTGGYTELAGIVMVAPCNTPGNMLLSMLEVTTDEELVILVESEAEDFPLAGSWAALGGNSESIQQNTSIGSGSNL